MGNIFKKPKNAPDIHFVKQCKDQGFSATSPPVYLGKNVHTIDLDVENNIFYVERSFNGTLQHRYPCRLEYIDSDDIRIVYNDDINYDVVDIHSVSNGDIIGLTKSGTYRVKKELFNHEYFPKFVETGHKQYDLLYNLYYNAQYGNFDHKN